MNVIRKPNIAGLSNIQFVGLFLMIPALLGIVWQITTAGKRTLNTVHGNARTLDIAFIQYEDAHGGHTPPADHWEDALKPYLDEQGTESLVKVPVEQGQPAQRFAMNEALSDVNLRNLLEPDNQVLLYVTQSNSRNAHGTPPKSIQPSPANVVVYANGSVNEVFAPFKPLPR